MPARLESKLLATWRNHRDFDAMNRDAITFALRHL
jgi:hypothetical protein